MYQLMGSAPGNSDLEEALAKVDTFISVAPCLYAGLAPADLNTRRKEIQNQLKAWDTYPGQYLFGYTDITPFQEFCAGLGVDILSPDYPLICYLSFDELSVYYGTTSIQQLMAADVTQTERELYKNGYSEIIDNYIKGKWPKSTDAIDWTSITEGPDVVHINAGADDVCL